LAVTLQVIKELADNRRRQALDGHAIDGAAPLVDWRMAATASEYRGSWPGCCGEIALGHQMLQQEPTNPRPRRHSFFMVGPHCVLGKALARRLEQIGVI